MIVDTHTHVVAPDERAYPLSPRPLSGEWYRKAPCSAEGLLERMDASGVDRAILVQALGAYSYDNRYATDSAAAHPDRFVAACCVDPEADDPVGELSFQVEARGAQGVRLFAISKGASWLAEERSFPLWERAAELGAHVIVTILGHQLDELRQVLERFPEISVSLDHCGFPDVADPSPLFAMADLPNLHLKLTTHALDAAAEAFGSAGGFVASLVERFGADRVMWGSDFCQIYDRPYGQLVKLGTEAFAGLPKASREACLGGNALRLWPALRG
jgi:predicted TIM-barrel fold metal-dependent hydrolase